MSKVVKVKDGKYTIEYEVPKTVTEVFELSKLEQRKAKLEARKINLVDSMDETIKELNKINDLIELINGEPA